METYIFTPPQCVELLASIEKSRAKHAKQRPTPTRGRRWLENDLQAYITGAARYRNFRIQPDRLGFTYTRGDDSVTLELVCSHDCGRCVYYLYILKFEKGSPLAREILERVGEAPNPNDGYVRFTPYTIYSKKALEASTVGV